jgi:F0F1-type ATP synthase assembly protein I
LPKKPQQPKEERKNSGDQGRAFMKYSGMAFEMAAILFVFVFGGKKLDEVVETETPWFTILGLFLGAFAALYFTLKDLFINKK